MPGPELQLKRWKRIEYEQLVEKGVAFGEGWDVRTQAPIALDGDIVSACAAPAARVAVADLLP